MTSVLPVAYFPPVEYFTVLVRYSAVYLDPFENYQKQSYRNRCRILSANGPEDLNFPIIHDGSRLITDIKVDYSTPWLRRTEYAIDSAYYNSPFFEYYRDGLFAVLDSRPERLWDLDVAVIEFFCSRIGIPVPRVLDSAAVAVGADRPVIHPKVPGDFVGKEYWQVFREKFGFVSNLSIMDLLFNEGPESVCYLK